MIDDFQFVKMTSNELKKRTRLFALRIFRLVEALPKSHADKLIAMQLMRPGSSIKASYPSAYKAEFRAKWGTMIEELMNPFIGLELIIERHLPEIL